MTEEAVATGSEEFAGRLIGVLNGGALALMLSIGHRTGLFDAMATLPPSTSAQIAEFAGLDERYVREWLGAMTTGRIVDHDPDQLTFALPPERAAWLTRAAGPANLALQAQYVGLLALVEDQIVHCFRHGGGVPYSAYPAFQALMAEDSGAVHDAALIDGILPVVPGLLDRLRRGIDVADIGCGSGHSVNLMAQAYPASPLRGHGHFRFRAHGRDRRGRAQGSSQRPIPEEGRRHTRWIGSVRLHHDLRRRARPGPS